MSQGRGFRRPRRRKIVAFLAHDQQACLHLIESMDRGGHLVNLNLHESKQIGDIGFLVFEEKVNK